MLIKRDDGGGGIGAHRKALVKVLGKQNETQTNADETHRCRAELRIHTVYRVSVFGNTGWANENKLAEDFGGLSKTRNNDFLI